MNFLLINPYIDSSSMPEIVTQKASLPPLGLLYIASSLEQKGHAVTFIDFCGEEYSDNKLKGCLNDIDAVGITVRDYSVKSTKNITKIIKSYSSKISVIIGGPHCTINSQKALENTNADICVEGDGEYAIIQIAEYLQGKKKIEDIPGVFYKKDGAIKNGPPAEVIENLDSIPFPNRNLSKKYKYSIDERGFTICRGKVTSLIMSRGCPYGCRFCVNKAITKKYRVRSAENIISEIEIIKKDYDVLYIMDDNFLVDIKTSIRILDYLIEENNSMKIIIAGIRADAANKEIFKKMKKAGVTAIAIGLESGNQDVLDFYNKQITLEQSKKAVKLSRKHGFFTSGSFIFGAPIETEMHLQNTIDFAKKLPLDVAVFIPLSYVKGSPLWYEAVSKGLIDENEHRIFSSKNPQLCNFTEKELWGWVIKAFREFYFRPSYILSEFFYQAFIRRDFGMIKDAIKMFSGRKNIFKAEVKDLYID